jgi:hypothetical protein
MAAVLIGPTTKTNNNNKGIRFFETSVHFYHPKDLNIPGETNLQQYRCENLRNGKIRNTYGSKQITPFTVRERERDTPTFCSMATTQIFPGEKDLCPVTTNCTLLHIRLIGRFRKIAKSD